MDLVQSVVGRRLYIKADAYFQHATVNDVRINKHVAQHVAVVQASGGPFAKQLTSMGMLHMLVVTLPMSRELLIYVTASIEYGRL